MSRYIDKQMLISALNAKSEMALGTPKAVFAHVSKMVELLPTADVAEVKHGRWVVIDGTPYCHVCRRQCDYNGDGTHSKSLFCPNCGAKMDGGDKS